MVIGYSTYKNLLGRYLAGLQKTMGEDLLACAVFGSVARGTARRDSDIDLLIVHGGTREKAWGDFDHARRFPEVAAEDRELRRAGLMPDVFPVFLTPERLVSHPWILLDIQEKAVSLFDSGILGDELTVVRQKMAGLGSRKVNLPDGSWYWELKPGARAGELIIL